MSRERSAAQKPSWGRRSAPTDLPRRCGVQVLRERQTIKRRQLLARSHRNALERPDGARNEMPLAPQRRVRWRLALPTSAGTKLSPRMRDRRAVFAAAGVVGPRPMSLKNTLRNRVGNLRWTSDTQSKTRAIRSPSWRDGCAKMYRKKASGLSTMVAR
jgi:hypothetical protein